MTKYERCVVILLSTLIYVLSTLLALIFEASLKTVTISQITQNNVKDTIDQANQTMTRVQTIIEENE